MARPTVIAGGSPAELDDELVDVELPTDDDAPAGSVLAQMRAAAEVQRQARTLDLSVGGALEQVVIRYRVLERREWDKYAALFAPSTRKDDAGAMAPMSVLSGRMMAAACQTVLWRHDDGTLEDLHVRIDGRLARMLGHPLAEGMSYDDLSVLEVVERLFASPMAVDAHAGELIGWMRDPTVDPGSAEGEG